MSDPREPAPTITVGSTLYVFDQNRRVYQRDEQGRSIGAPIFSKHFVPETVIGETPLSWLLSPQSKPRKVNKKTMKIAATNGYGGWNVYTATQMEDSIWGEENRRKIIRAIERCDVATLKAVAAIIGGVQG